MGIWLGNARQVPPTDQESSPRTDLKGVERPPAVIPPQPVAVLAETWPAAFGTVVELCWTLDCWRTTRCARMGHVSTEGGNDRWWAVLPGLPEGAYVEYYLRACEAGNPTAPVYDSNGRLPSGQPRNYHLFTSKAGWMPIDRSSPLDPGPSAGPLLLVNGEVSIHAPPRLPVRVEASPEDVSSTAAVLSTDGWATVRRAAGRPAAEPADRAATHWRPSAAYDLGRFGPGTVIDYYLVQAAGNELRGGPGNNLRIYVE
jgi:hypothetical protein